MARPRYLITGGSGFLGRTLIQRLVDMGETEVTVVSRSEANLIVLGDCFPHIRVIPGDIADPYVCTRACRGIDRIFHLAAFKHVGLAESNTRQCIATNIIGTMNLLEETRRTMPEFILGISTDKAAQVNGVYGASKFLQERLFLEYEQLNSLTKYRTVRYGNVFYSTASVLCKWKDKLQRGEEIIVTDPAATRFYLSVEQAVNIIFNCLAHAQDARAYIAEMKAASIGQLLEVMITKYSLSPHPEIRTTGLQPGESLHEVLIEGGPNSSQVEQYTNEELYAVV